jgi:hypothetical protein
MYLKSKIFLSAPPESGFNDLSEASIFEIGARSFVVNATKRHLRFFFVNLKIAGEPTLIDT